MKKRNIKYQEPTSYFPKEIWEKHFKDEAAEQKKATAKKTKKK